MTEARAPMIGMPTCGIDVVDLPEHVAQQLEPLILRVYLEPSPGHPHGLISVPCVAIRAWVHAQCAGRDTFEAISMASSGKVHRVGLEFEFISQWRARIGSLRLNVPPLEALL